MEKLDQGKDRQNWQDLQTNNDYFTVDDMKTSIGRLSTLRMMCVARLRS